MAQAPALQPRSNVPQRQYVVHPRIFVVWLFILSSCMMFAGFTSAFILSSKDAAWRDLPMPSAMTVSTIIILLSSLTMHTAVRAARRDDVGQVKMMLTATFFLGLGFLAAQWVGFSQLVSSGFNLVSVDKNGSFLYIVAGLHMLHIVGGLCLILGTLLNAFRFKVHSRQMTGLLMTSTFWHFIDLLWLYLFVFFTLSA